MMMTTPQGRAKILTIRALEALTDKALEDKQHAGKSRAQVYTHLAQHSPVGQKLMQFATQWDLERRHDTGA